MQEKYTEPRLLHKLYDSEIALHRTSTLPFKLGKR